MLQHVWMPDCEGRRAGSMSSSSTVPRKVPGRSKCPSVPRTKNLCGFSQPCFVGFAINSWALLIKSSERQANWSTAIWILCFDNPNSKTGVYALRLMLRDDENKMLHCVPWAHGFYPSGYPTNWLNFCQFMIYRFSSFFKWIGPVNPIMR